MAVCVAVVAKEAFLTIQWYPLHKCLTVFVSRPRFIEQNYPLFLKTVSSDKDLKFYYTVHTSLDVVEEKIASVTKSTNDLRELYLGLLYPTEDYRVYGYVTNTKIKFVIVVESSNTSLRDNEIRNMFRQLHLAYVDMVCNPFYVPGDYIASRNFDKVITNMMVQE